MVKRKARKTKTRKTKSARKTRSRKTRRKTTRTKKTRSSKMKSMSANKKAHWEAYRHLQKRCDQAWSKLKADVKRKASPEVLVKDKNHLMLLLGECNYMASECMRFSSRRKG